MKKKTILKDMAFTSGILLTAFVISLSIVGVFDTHSPIPAIFSLAVFLISRYTESFIYGVAASLIGMLAVYFAFTFPYFRFNFIILENLVSAIMMLIISIMTSVLTTELKRQEKLRVETEKEKMRANLLRAISHDLRTPLTTIYGSSSVMAENAKEEPEAANVIDIEPKEEISYDDFMKMQFQVGEIIACEEVPKSKKLLCSQVRVGSQVRQIVSGIKAHYTPEEMVGKKVMVLVNLKPAKLAGVMSEGMLLCAEDAEGNLALMTPEKEMPAGAEIC